MLSRTPAGGTRTTGVSVVVDDETPPSTRLGSLQAQAGKAPVKALFGLSRMDIGEVIWVRTSKNSWWPARIQPDKSGEFRTERTCHIEYLHPHAAVGCGEPEWVDRASRVVRFTATRLVGNSDASTEPDAQCTIALKLQGKTYDVDATGLLDSTETQERWLDEPDPMQALGILVDKDGSYASGTGKATTKQLKKAIKEALVQWVANKDRLAALSIEAAGSVADSPKRSRTRVTPFVAESATAHNRVVSPKRSPSKSPAKGAAGKRPAKRPAQPKKLSLGGDGDHSPVAGRAAAASSSEAEVEVTEQGAPVSRVKRARVQSNGVGAGAAAAGAAAAGAAAAATAMELDEVFGPASETASLSGLYPFASTRHPEFRTHAAPLVTSEKFSNFFKSEIGSLFEDAQAEAGQSTMAMLLRGAMAGTSPSAVPRAIELNMMWRTLCGDDASGNVDVAMATQFVDCFRRAAYWATEGHRDLLGNTEAAWQAYTAVISKVFGSVTVPPDHDGPPSPDFIIKYCAQGILSTAVGIFDEFPSEKKLLRLLSNATGGVMDAATEVTRKALTPFESGRRENNAFESCAQDLGARLLRHLYADLDEHAAVRERVLDRCVFTAQAMDLVDLHRFLETLAPSDLKTALLQRLLAKQVPGGASTLAKAVEKAIDPETDYPNGAIDTVYAVLFEAIKGYAVTRAPLPTINMLQVDEFLSRYVLDSGAPMAQAHLRSKCFRVVALQLLGAL